MSAPWVVHTCPRGHGPTIRVHDRLCLTCAEAGEIVECVPTQVVPLPPMHNPDHDQPFAAFVQAMADELAANAHKGDRAGWLTMTYREAVGEVLYHAAKLTYAARQYDQGDGPAEKIREFAADVANCSMMVADICGVLEGEARRAA